jgi:hypothetical protein
MAGQAGALKMKNIAPVGGAQWKRERVINPSKTAGLESGTGQHTSN